MQIGLGLWLGTRQVSGASGPFDPAAVLFGAGEQGGWYDPSDLTTMFQDSVGTAPVTATGQTVGLLLDKSQGLTLGPELVTNGDFSSTADWTLGTGWSIGSGVATKTAGVAGAIRQTAALVVGRTYKITYTVSGATSGTCAAAFIGGTQVTGSLSGANGVRTEYLVVTTGNTQVGVTANTTFNGSIDDISVKELAGNHLTQTTAASRPQYQIDANGLPFLLFDGTDDWFISPTITPGTNKAQVFAGVRKLAETSGMLLESSTSAQSNQGSFLFRAPSSATANYSVSSGGTSLIGATATASGYPAPITNVVSFQSDIAGPSLVLRVNNAQVASSVTSQGTGNFNAYPLYVGRRGGTTTPFNGRVYQMIVRFGANLDAATITATETFVNSKTGAF